MFAALAKFFGRREPLERSLRLRKRDRLEAKYDAAATTELNRKYWANADLLSADAANSPEVRAKIRSRARYECLESNSILRGIVQTHANYVIGRGPRLQMQIPGRPDLNREIERIFHDWANVRQLGRKLRTMKLSKMVDGEAFGQFITNRRSLHPVTLDISLFEADQCSTPTPLLSILENAVDGIVFDEFGEPVEYHRLRAHPGSGLSTLEFDRLPADQVLHIYRMDRPGQHRGISEVATALPLVALLRDYILAVLHNARTTAKFTAVLETAATNLGSGDIDDVEAFDACEVDYDMLTAVPKGWKMHQFQPQQPATTFEMFVKGIINQIARCVDMPLNVAMANSSGYNYSSGRLDWQSFFKSIEVERSEWESIILDRILRAFLDEALVLPGLLPSELGPLSSLPHEWHWDGLGHVDPAKEAAGQQLKLKSGTTHRAREYAREGLDVDVEDERAAESCGVSVGEYRRAVFLSLFGDASNAEESSDDADDDDDETAQERAAAA